MAEVVEMLVTVVLTFTVIIAIMAALWPERDRSKRDQRSRATATADATKQAPSPETLEGVLVRQIMSGEITKGQYERAMAGLAARDADRHPLEVPPDTVPPES